MYIIGGYTMPYSDAHKKAAMKYAKKHLKRVPLDMQLSQYDTIKAHADATGETVNGFIKRAIAAQIERDKETEGK